MAKIKKCPHYDSFFGTCNLYQKEQANYEHDDNELVDCKCTEISDCDFKLKED